MCKYLFPVYRSRLIKVSGKRIVDRGHIKTNQNHLITVWIVLAPSYRTRGVFQKRNVKDSCHYVQSFLFFLILEVYSPPRSFNQRLVTIVRQFFICLPFNLLKNWRTFINVLIIEVHLPLWRLYSVPSKRPQNGKWTQTRSLHSITSFFLENQGGPNISLWCGEDV